MKFNGCKIGEDKSDSDFSYVDESSDISTSEEEILFNKKVEIPDESSHEGVWYDSEKEEDELRKEFKTINNFEWCTNSEEEVQTNESKKIRILLDQRICSAQNNLKHVKIFSPEQSKFEKNGPAIMVSVTTRNDLNIYFDNFENKIPDKSINLNFSIADFCFINGDKILIVNGKNGLLKELSLATLVVKDIKKGYQNIFKKIIFDKHVFVQSNKLMILNSSNYGLIYEFVENILDFALDENMVYVLTEQKRIVVYDRSDFSVVKNLKFDDGFFFQNIFILDNNLIISMQNRVKILNEKFEPIKEILKFQVDKMASSKQFFSLCGIKENQLRIIMKDKYEILSAFPFSKYQLPRVVSIFSHNNNLYFAHQKYISKITISTH
ncbi:hypothetical protein EDEG_00493 [Edhazardia aedis USNM 41457]|uniref:CNH domain-containing protein n=1 Tax=Edhazardia aedis (strain USNM 41457) TaxID=1003232 RepID=J8ZNP4_EDHAE|nr:hypothetical protein EDEG_00493 [Edhazardia aedis USNM 41457]|eukprot:EJW01308.1 hypothetical protein EDEG_00493 [Edhazardia aedis USNM 41457]